MPAADGPKAPASPTYFERLLDRLEMPLNAVPESHVRKLHLEAREMLFSLKRQVDTFRRAQAKVTPDLQAQAVALELAEQLKTEAHEYASMWSSVGGPFDAGGMLDEAQQARGKLYAKIDRLAALATRPAEPAPVVEAAGEPWSEKPAVKEWQTPPASWRMLAKAALELLWAIDEKHDRQSPPLKYSIPYGAVNDLRIALDAARPIPAPIEVDGDIFTMGDQRFIGRNDPIPAAAPVAKAELTTVPWPVVDAYAGGADAGGVASWLKVRLGDGPETTEFVRKDLIAAPVAGEALTDKFIDSHTAHIYHRGKPVEAAYRIGIVRAVEHSFKRVYGATPVTQAAVGASTLGREFVIPVQSVWEALGGNPSLRPTQAEVIDLLRKVGAEFNAAQPPIAAPAGDDRAWQIVLMTAAARSGDPGTIRLAAQLAGCPACEQCGYVKTACRCSTTSSEGASRG